MASTPINSRTYVASTSLGLKSSPSPFPRTPRPSNKNRKSLRVGIIVEENNWHDSIFSTMLRLSLYFSNICIYGWSGSCAVAANAGNTAIGGPSTPASNANDGRNGKGFRDAAIPYAPSIAHTSLESGDSSRTWSSRERIKAATCVSISSDGRFLAVGETGYAPRVLIFSLQDNSSDSPLAILTEHYYGVAAIAFSPDGRYLASLVTPPLSPISIDECNEEVDAGHLCAMGYAGGNFVTIDSRHTIEIWGKDDEDADHGFQNTLQPAHGDAVMGVQLLPENNQMGAAFLTWSVNGSLAFWDLHGNSKGSITIGIDHVSMDEEASNSCQVVRISKQALFLVSGDKYGILKILDPSTGACTFETRAHSTEIQDIAIYEDETSTMVASCSRDRTIQLFRRVLYKWELVQTLDEHTAGVCGLFFAENGEKLISCGMDRTIHIRQIVKKEAGEGDVLAAVPVRIITLKAAPISMTPCFGAQVGNLVVSLLDRSVATYEIASGRLLNSFQATVTMEQTLSP
ncbi:hypothetical protein EYC84_000871 [Monilinia fructicola]|uniref:Uncharacterized protein n=1 Tax=Monilinia fructicola TaxID=38448 RepID=A0A5M9JN23_MONFR|nr:hypothetical protein EYC84_000871 [Monilinia fructicola]